MAVETPFAQRIRNLPTPSPVLQRINAVMANPESGAGDLVGALKLDPAIAGKVLRLANSAYIGIPRTVSSLQNAVVLLGQRRILSLVAAASLLSKFELQPGAGGLDLRRFWQHSFTVGMVCESIGKHLKRYETVDADETFTAGIMHDIGKLALGGYDPDRLAAALRRSREEGVALFAAEEPQYSHTAVGEILARHWNFPVDLSESIRYHHEPRSAQRFGRLVAIVHLADIMVHILGLQTYEDETVPQFDEGAIALVRLSPERLRVIAEETARDQQRVESLIEFIK